MLLRARALVAVLAVIAATTIGAAVAVPAVAAPPTAATSVTVDAPRPAGASSVSVGAPVCKAARVCIAAGSYTGADKLVRPLLEVTTGRADGSWQAVAIASPAGSTGAYLTAVACPSTSECYAIGNYSRDPDGISSAVGFAVTLSAGTITRGTWTLVSLPGTATLNALSCPVTHRCVAVGSVADRSGVPVLTFDGTSVRSTVVALPAGATTQGADEVSCATSSFCSTGSAAFTDSGTDVLVYDNGRATFRALPGLTDSAGTVYDNVFAPSVSCPVTGFCVYADQGYFDSGYRDSPIALLYSVYDNGTLSTALVPLPAGKSEPVGNTRSTYPVWTVSCLSRSSCAGIGSLQDYDSATGTSPQIGFVDTLSNGSISSSTVATDLATTNQNGPPLPLVLPITGSCPAVGQCAVGSNQATSPGPTGVVSLRTAGAVPVTVPIAAPKGLPANQTVVIDALSCRPGLTFCAGVGRAGTLVVGGYSRTVLTTITAA